MKSTYEQLKSIFLDTSQVGILSINIQKRIIKILFFIALFSTIAFLNIKIALAVTFAALIIRGIVFIKEIAALDFNFTLNKEDLAEIEEQMWR